LTYVVFRHENAFGNTCEQVINLAIHLENNLETSKKIRVAVEHQWQSDLVRLITGSENFQIDILGEALHKSFKLDWLNLDHLVDNPILPSYYAHDNYEKYNAGWEFIDTLKLPIFRKLNGDNFDVVIQFRVKNSWNWRGEKNNPDLSRFVSESTFVEIISNLCEMGLKVARIGGKSDKIIYNHPNYCDTTLLADYSLKSQLSLVSQASVFVSTDSSIWPLGPALGTRTLITNVTSVLNFLEPLPIFGFNRLYLPHGKFFATKGDLKVIKPYIFDWIGNQNKYLLKRVKIFFGFVKIKDNSVQEVVSEIKHLLN
jgi:hypothetical protein